MAYVEAPLAQLEEGDDWQEFNDHHPIADRGNSPGDLGTKSTTDGRSIEAIFDDQRGLSDPTPNHRTVLPEAVLDRETGLVRCFRAADCSSSSEILIERQERTVNDNEVWKQLSNRLKAVQLVTWPESRACHLQENSLKLKDTAGHNGNQSSDNLDLSDDEELKQCMDLHGLILNSECDVQPIKSADEVISEIEEMMDDDEFEAERSTITIDGPSKTAEVIRTKLKQAMPPGTTMVNCLKSMSTCDLETLQDDLETTIRDFSEVLVQELALREELDYQKELNNQFISLLLSIQRKRRELDVERKKGKVSSKHKEPPTVYLTTVIPYDDHLGPPDTDRLQIYLKIMTAIEEDSVTVPTLLTDYILKVLCPKT